MGLEDLTGGAKYISDLVNTNPVGATDAVSAGDDHIRGIKNVILNTFPNITGAVTSTAAELNILDGVTSTAAELNILDGVTSTAAELNILDGVTATATELNYNDITTLGTVDASKTVTVDASKNVGTFNNVTSTTFTGALTGNASTATTATTANAVAAAGLTEAALAAPLGVWIELSSQVPASDQYITFTNGSGGVVIDSTYDVYKLEWWDVYSGSGSGEFGIQVGTSGGFLTANYEFVAVYNDTVTAAATSDTGSGSYIPVTATTLPGGTTYRNSGSCIFRSPHTSTTTILRYENGYVDSSEFVSYQGHGHNTTTTAVDRIRFLDSFGANLTGGVIRLYGMHT